MKKIAILLTAAVSICLYSCGNNNTENKDGATVENKDTMMATPKNDTMATAPAAPMDSATKMKAYMEYSTPGEVHKMMASWAGKWDADVTSWMEPGKPEQKSKGSVDRKMILGGRYMMSMHTGNMGGMPFEGHEMLAYDNAKKMFLSSWMDNMGTGIMNSEGKWDDATKSVTMKGKMLDPATQKDCEVREVFTVVDDKHQNFEMYVTSPGQKEFKCMEAHYTKK
jgi:hypothetical protein